MGVHALTAIKSLKKLLFTVEYFAAHQIPDVIQKSAASAGCHHVT